MASQYDFRGKVALVCGAAAGGIGDATTTKLVRSGAFIVVVDHADAILEESISAIRGNGGECLGIRADLRDPRQVATIVPKALQHIAGIDFVANIAGGTKREQWNELIETTDQVFNDVMALNVNYVFQLCRDVARVMIERKIRGSFVNISSISGINSAPYHAVYGAAKRAVVALTESMAVEWGEYGIRANTVAPGQVRSRRTEAYRSDLDRLAKEAPLERPVEREEIAEAIMFLLSDHASAITGQQLVVDCGVSKNCCSSPKPQLRLMANHPNPTPLPG